MTGGGVHPASPADGEIVGRDDELAQLARFLDDVAAGPASLVLAGDPGIGKTTLWRRAVETARSRAYCVLTCAATEAESVLTFAGLGDLLDDVLDETLTSLPAPQRRALEVALLRADAAGVPPDERAIALAARAVLRGLAAERPVLVAVDDAQWLDGATANVLAFAERRLTTERVGFLATVRGRAARVAVPLLDARAAEDGRRTLEVGPLPSEALGRLLATRLGAPVPHGRLRRVHAAAAGNPLYALELARAAGAADGPTAVPAPLHELLVERLSRLPAEVVELLVHAAALSAPTVAVLEAAADDPGTVVARLRTAAAADVVDVAGEHVRFRHPLLAEAALALVAPAARRRVHRRLADAVADPEERARLRALGADEPDAAIAAALDEASAAAAARGAPASAAELAGLALRATPPEDVAAGVARRLAHARRLVRAGEVPRARAELERLVTELAPGSDRARALVQLADLREESLEAAEALLEQALAEAASDEALQVTIESGLGTTALHRGALRLALERQRGAHAHAERIGDAALVVQTAARVGFLETLLVDDTPGLLERAVELEQRSGERTIAGPTRMLAFRAAIAGRLGAARASLEELLGDATARGDWVARALVCFSLAQVELRRGDLRSALRYADEGSELFEQMELEQSASALLAVRALVRAHVGDVDAARADLDAALRIADATGESAFRLQTEVAAAFLDLSLGDAAAAAERLRPLLAFREQAGIREPNFDGVPANAVEAFVAVGDLDAARHVLAGLEDVAAGLDRPPARAVAARCRGIVRAAEGDVDAALEAFAEALDHHARSEDPFERARTLLALGVAQRRGKRRREARESLEAAIELFAAVAAPLWEQRARAELARVSGRRPAGGLTETERRVAELAADGLSNKEVAAALFVTAKTVEGTLSRVYAKLGVRSRAELARRLGSNGAA